jgi:hypothetical protein
MVQPKIIYFHLLELALSQFFFHPEIREDIKHDGHYFCFISLSHHIVPLVGFYFLSYSVTKENGVEDGDIVRGLGVSPSYVPINGRSLLAVM